MTQLKNLIDANIKNNGNQEITGNVLNYVLTEVAKHTDKDWYESSETKSGYIYGRTHGVTSELVKVEGTLTQLGYKSGEYVSILHYPRLNGVLEGEQLYLNGLVYNPIIGQEYKVDYDGPNVYARIVAVEGGFDVQIKGSIDTGNVIKIAFVWIKTLDDAYISSKIARKSEVDALETKVNDKADSIGIYPSMQVGKSDDLSGHGESVPAEFTFRATGGKSIKDGTATIKEMEGNAVVWNQQYKPVSSAIGTRTINGITFTIYEDGTVEAEGTAEGGSAYVTLFYKTFIASHKYLLIAYGAPAGEWGKQGLYFVGITGLNEASMIKSAGYKIFQPSADGISNLSLTAWDGYSLSCRIRPIFYDLTQMFGAGNEPTTIEEFNARKPIVADEYAYNEGEVIAFNGDAVKSVGDNAWDEQWEKGFINYHTGNDVDHATNCRTVGYTQVIPNETYFISYPPASYTSDLVIICYDANKAFIQHIGGGSANKTFTIPANCHYIRFTWVGTEYNNNIMLTLVHSGWKVDTDAGYQPYWADTLQIDSRIKAEFPNGMHKWDKVYNKDGRGYIGKGTGVVDLGTLDWWHNNEGRMIAALASGVFNKVSDFEPANAICAQYPIETYIHVYTNNYGLALSYQEPYLYVTVFDSAYTDAASFKAAMAGTMLYYELAEPTIIEFDTPFKLDYKVADFGTEELISEQPSAPFKARTIYQFNAVDQIRENYNEIEKIKAALAKAGITIDL